MTSVQTLYPLSIYHLSLDPEGRRIITDDLATSCLHLCLSCTVLGDSGESSPVHSVTLSSHCFRSLPQDPSSRSHHSAFIARLSLPCQVIGRHYQNKRCKISSVRSVDNQHKRALIRNESSGRNLYKQTQSISFQCISVAK